MFKRHRISKYAMLAYAGWWLLFFTALCSSSDSIDRMGFTEATGLITFVYFAVLVVKIFTADAIHRRDFLKMLVLVLLPVVLPLLAFIIYLLCGGRILTRLW